jgi:hypothetical protein
MALDEATRASIASFKKAMKERSDAVHTNAGKAVLGACVMVENEAKLGMKTTQLDTSKKYKIGGRLNKKTHRLVGYKIHYPSQEWDYPAIDTGRLWQSITHDISEHFGATIGRVGSNVDEGLFTEHGTSKMVPRPWLRPALLRHREDIHAMLDDAARGREVSIESES